MTILDEIASYTKERIKNAKSKSSLVIIKSRYY